MARGKGEPGIDEVQGAMLKTRGISHFLVTDFNTLLLTTPHFSGFFLALQGLQYRNDIFKYVARAAVIPEPKYLM